VLCHLLLFPVRILLIDRQSVVGDIFTHPGTWALWKLLTLTFVRSTIVHFHIRSSVSYNNQTLPSDPKKNGPSALGAAEGPARFDRAWGCISDHGMRDRSWGHLTK